MYCSGAEAELGDCYYYTYRSNYCSQHQHDVGIRCLGKYGKGRERIRGGVGRGEREKVGERGEGIAKWRGKEKGGEESKGEGRGDGRWEEGEEGGEGSGDEKEGQHVEDCRVEHIQSCCLWLEHHKLNFVCPNCLSGG